MAGFLASIVPDLISGAASLLGGKSANLASARQARLNRQFQERMSSTSHQRAVKDLRAAGLNPILSALGGASTPAGSMAQQQDVVTPAVSTAMAARRLREEIKSIKADVRVKDETANAQMEQANLSRSQQETQNFQRAYLRSQSDLLDTNTLLQGYSAANAKREHEVYSGDYGKALKYFQIMGGPSAINSASSLLPGIGSIQKLLKKSPLKGKK